MVCPIFNDLGVSENIVETSKFYGEYAGEHTRMKGVDTYQRIPRTFWSGFHVEVFVGLPAMAVWFFTVVVSRSKPW